LRLKRDGISFTKRRFAALPILSSKSSLRRQQRKIESSSAAFMLNYGVQEYWIVDPKEKTIEVLTLGKQGYERAGLYRRDETLTSKLLPGLQISLTEVF
jgi:Uma2 family endonuclease